MSDRDTDDTDALLAADPNGGLEMFLGLSLSELTEKHRKILSPGQEDVNSKKTLGPFAKEEASTERDKDSVATDSTLNNLESDKSDFFNSKGELVLSGLSEWSDSESQGDDTTRTSNVENEDVQSDDGSESSFTYENSGNHKGQEDHVDTKETDVAVKPMLDDVSESKEIEVYREGDGTCFVGNNPPEFQGCAGFGLLMDNGLGGTQCHSVIQRYSVRHSMQNIPQGFSFGQSVNINLLRPSAGWNIPMPRFPNGGEQMFTRAPNFRTPGGYRPPKNPKPCRDLSEEQIIEEMKNMYAFPEEKDVEEVLTEDSSVAELNTDIKAQKKKLKKVLRFSEVPEEIKTNEEGRNLSMNCHPKSPELKVDFLQGDIPVTFGSGGSAELNGKAMKRKQVVPTVVHDGSGDCAATYEQLSKPETSESTHPETNSSSLRTPVPYSTKVIRGKRNNRKKTSKKFSFGYGDESELSPIRGESLGGCKIDSPVPVPKYEQSSSRPIFSPNISSANPVSISLDDLKLVWREIETRRQLLEDQQSNDKELVIEDLGNVCASDDSNKVVANAAADNATDSIKSSDETTADDCYSDSIHSIPRLASSCYSAPVPTIDEQDSNRYSVNHMDQNRVLPMLEGFAADLENILQEADIRPDEFQNIIQELGEGDDVTGGIAELLEGLGIEGDTNNPEPLFVETNEISDWAKSGAVEYVKKFHDEQFKRQECEAEIRNLQRDMLVLRQRNAVLEGNMLKKDGTLRKLTAAWNHVSKEWKAHEATSKSALAQLQQEQQELLTTCRQDKDRILEYEKQLMKTVEVAETFKSKIVEIEESKVHSLALANEEIKKKATAIETLTKNLDDVSNEKNAALRALRESQLQMDELRQQLSDLKNEATTLSAKGQEESINLAAMRQEKGELLTRLNAVSQENKEYSCKIEHLQEKVTSVETSKELLRQTLGCDAAQKVKDESERLHEYYNKKVQEVIKSASEKALKAETTLVDSMKKANLETERKLSECRERHEAELSKLKYVYESEIKMLKQENVQKQLLISTTAQQLQTGEFSRTGAVNRLESIVSAIPSVPVIPASTRTTTTLDYKRASQQVQFSKFSDNLNSPSLSQPGVGSFSTQHDSLNRGVRDRTFLDVSSERNHRYTKTSTPIVHSHEEIDQTVGDSGASKDTDIVAKASKLFQYFEMANAKVPSDTIDCADHTSLSELVKVSVGSNKPKKLKSHDIIPERLKQGFGKKEEGTTKTPKLRVELQKCLEEVLQSYVQQLDLKDLKTRSSDINVAPEPASTSQKDENLQHAVYSAVDQPQVAVSNNNNSTLDCDTKGQKSQNADRSSCQTEENVNNSNSSVNKSQRKSKGGKHPWK